MNEKPNMEETVPGRLDELRQSVDARFRAGDERMGRIEVDLAENTATTNRIDANSGGGGSGGTGGGATGGSGVVYVYEYSK